MPRVLFALVPVLAAILGLFFRGRKFPEHLYFVLHLDAFVFVALTIVEAAKLTHAATLAGAVGVAVGLWIAGYAIVALRRVYGEPLGRTLAKGLGATVLYSAVSVVAMLGLVYWAAVFA
jgi:hypothetical protein